MKHYFQFSAGQIVFIAVCLVIGGFLDFYFGARFGPEIFWGIDINQKGEISLLPEDLTDAELEEMIEQEGPLLTTFHEELEKKSAPLTPPLKPIEIVKAVKKETPKAVGNHFKTSSGPLTFPSPSRGEGGGEGDLVSGRYSLKVGSFSSIKEARILEQKLVDAGYPVFLQKEFIPDKGYWYRVHVGRYRTSSEALQKKRQIEKTLGVMPVLVGGGPSSSQ